jgi:hypothetical protein
MIEKNLARVFGMVRGGAGFAEFKGEIVSVDRIDGDNVDFFHLGSKFSAHKRQLGSVALLYPNVIYVKEPSLENSSDDGDVFVKTTEISNCYARRGSHWVKYIIDPQYLALIDEEDETEANQKALECAEIFVSAGKLHSILKEEIPGITYDQIVNILQKI